VTKYKGQHFFPEACIFSLKTPLFLREQAEEYKGWQFCQVAIDLSELFAILCQENKSWWFLPCFVIRAWGGLVIWGPGSPNLVTIITPDVRKAQLNFARSNCLALVSWHDNHSPYPPKVPEEL
jgi:hypothetical protein